jgi:hypothetical protein
MQENQSAHGFEWPLENFQIGVAQTLIACAKASF